MLWKGNTWPFPGPDGWEKWCVKALNDRTLVLIVTLHNYVVETACFPGNIKNVWATALYKQGLCTDLSNYRGLQISNFLANSPMTWLNYCLTPYVARLGIIPEMQVVTQQGVQARDLVSFLSGVKTWAQCHKTEVWCLKHNQMKGFDYLAPQGFHNAVTAYGLPALIIELNCAAQNNVKCSIRTAHGMTEPIFISGVTKQGSPLSPRKSTLTTSLGHCWLFNLASNSDSSLLLRSLNAEHGNLHLPNDKTELQVAMAKAMYDSYLFARNEAGLMYFTLSMERFQFVYGWLTQ